MNKIVILIGAKLLLLWAITTAVLLGVPNAHAAELQPFDGQTPALKLPEFGRDAVLDLNDLSGKLVMVQFWATYCTPCRVEMPSMNRLQARLGEQFRILAVNMGESTEEVQQFVDEVRPEFTILMDAQGEALGQWKVFAAPATFIVDPAGKIRFTLFGATEWDSPEMVEALSALM